MTLRSLATPAIAVISFCVAPALAGDIRVIVVDSFGFPCQGNSQNFTHAPGQAISISVSTCTREVYVYAEDAPFSDDIGRITINGTGPVSPKLKITIGASFSNGDTDPTTAGRNWAGLQFSELNTMQNSQLHGGIAGSLTGSVDIGTLMRFDIDGTINANIVAERSGQADPVGGVTVVEGGSLASGRKIEVKNGTVRRVRFAQSISGSVLVPNGDVEQQVIAGWAGGGSINILNTRVLRRGIKADGNLTNITVTGTQNLSNQAFPIDATSTITSLIVSPSSTIGLAGTARVFAIGSTSGPDLAVSTPIFSGSMQIDGPVRKRMSLGSWNPAASSRILIGGAVDVGTATSTRAITFASSGLTNSLVLDFDNISGIPSTTNWLSDVAIGPANDPAEIRISPAQPQPYQAPYYEVSSAALGGGAVGLVPFHFHQGVDCEPETDSLLHIAPAEVILEYYGPIAETNAASGVPPFIVERARMENLPIPLPCVDNNCTTGCPDAATANWTDITAQFTYAMHPGGNTRRIRITPVVSSPTTGFGPAGRHYRIRPVVASGASNRLVCDIPGSPAVLEPTAHAAAFFCAEQNYKFTRSSTQFSRMDTNESFEIETADVLEWAAALSDVDDNGVSTWPTRRPSVPTSA